MISFITSRPGKGSDKPAASQLPGGRPTDVDNAPVPAHKLTRNVTVM